jgi:dihydroorotate dehydrogenase electron transfer subunit
VSASICLEDAEMIGQDEMRGGYRRLTLRAPAIAPRVRPGQFVHLRVPHMNEALLRRPFSVYRAEGDRLMILYKAVGRGTLQLAFVKPGETLSLIGPLGNGFPPVRSGEDPVLVAGGYGMAALYMTARESPVKARAFFGGRTADDILCVEEFEALGWTVHVATEDGSAGVRGRVTDALDPWLAGPEAPSNPVLYACGPNAMLRAVADRAAARDRTAWISMDRNMGCGVGACLTCVQTIRADDGRETRVRVCKEGPVFESRSIVWEREGGDAP